MDRGLTHRGTADEAQPRDAPFPVLRLRFNLNADRSRSRTCITRLDGCKPTFDSIPEEVF